MPSEHWTSCMATLCYQLNIASLSIVKFSTIKAIEHYLVDRWCICITTFWDWLWVPTHSPKLFGHNPNLFGCFKDVLSMDCCYHACILAIWFLHLRTIFLRSFYRWVNYLYLFTFAPQEFLPGLKIHKQLCSIIVPWLLLMPKQ